MSLGIKAAGVLGLGPNIEIFSKEKLAACSNRGSGHAGKCSEQGKRSCRQVGLTNSTHFFEIR
jgi:hypothetical protein